MLKKTSNFILGDCIAGIKYGMRRNMRFWNIHKNKLAMKIMDLLYNQGVIRAYVINRNSISVYYKKANNRHLIRDISVVSTPGKRIYWQLNKLSKNYNYNEFAGFYIVSTQKGLVTSDYCILHENISGEILIKVIL